jgi:hypothetical protein
VNHRRPWWIVFSLLPPLFALFALLLPFGCGTSGPAAPSIAPTPGSIAVAFVGQAPPGNFSQVLLNISGIRINPLGNADVSAPGWVNISVPTDAGGGVGQNPGELQIDLLHTQTAATFFNTGGVPPGTYQSVQVLVDDVSPGTIVPACASAGSGNEGCARYPMAFNSIQPATLFTLDAPLTVSANATAPLVINLALDIASLPASSGQPYMLNNVTGSQVINTGSLLAQVTGSIIQTKVSTGVRIQPQTVFAEVSGTNTIIESVPVKTKGVYTLYLPAAPEGTSYDIYVAGGKGTYGARRGITVVPGQGLTGEDLPSVQSSTGTFSGVIADFCTGIGIPGAQLELLAPPATPTTGASPAPTPIGSSFCFNNPNQCVVVASATADQAGNYPLPGNFKIPMGFDQVPVGQRDLALMVTASGYSPIVSSALAQTGNQATCSASTSATQCSFSLSTGYITGQVNLTTDPPPGSSVFVQVLAENTGTNQLVSALSEPLTFLNGETSLSFTMNVPINPQVTGYDLFAIAIDPFANAPDPFPGHDIPVISNVPAPGACCPPGVTGPCLAGGSAPTATPTPIPFAAMDCVGHGSISGAVQNPDIGTSIEVEKVASNGSPVQILGTSPGLFSSLSPSNNAYSLCVPPDNYLLQRFELAAATPAATPGPTPVAVGGPQSINVPAPVSTSSPCPSSCSNNDIANFPCPGICGANNANPL